jgi:hypothetical protein
MEGKEKYLYKIIAGKGSKSKKKCMNTNDKQLIVEDFSYSFLLV